MQLRTATPTDLPALHALVQSAYRGDSARGGWTHEADLLDGQRTDETALAEMLSDPLQRVLLAEQAGEATVCVQIRDFGNATAYLGMLSVAPSLQAHGLGGQLIAAAEALARDAFGATRMEMTVITQRAELIAYYERRGYTRTGETRPFPLNDARFGLPKRGDLAFTVLAKALASD